MLLLGQHVAERGGVLVADPAAEAEIDVGESGRVAVPPAELVGEEVQMATVPSEGDLDGVVQRPE